MDKKNVPKGEKDSQRTKSRLEIECAKLDPKEEQAMAEEGFDADMREWPEF